MFRTFRHDEDDSVSETMPMTKGGSLGTIGKIDFADSVKLKRRKR
jgi:hypothetical protein